jgi:hypothetical protein
MMIIAQAAQLSRAEQSRAAGYVYYLRRDLRRRGELELVRARV